MEQWSGLDEKQSLRSALKERRKTLEASYCSEADAAIIEEVEQMECYRKASVIFCYVSMPGEVETTAWMKQAWKDGKRIAVPRCEARGIMEAYEIESLDDLESGAYGIREPKRSCPRVLPQQIDLCIIPCVAADKDGWRLGYGGGYYDRYLPQTEAVRVLLCREAMICERIPTEEHDCRMDFVVTELGVWEGTKKV